jgi:hypothetical protein
MTTYPRVESPYSLRGAMCSDAANRFFLEIVSA